MQHVVFNATNIGSATWLEREEIRQIHILNNRICHVYLPDGSKVKVTAEEIKPVMEERRRARAGNVEVTKLGTANYYTVRNPHKGTEYSVLPLMEHLTCTCPDYNNQSIAFDTEKIACQHIFAVLNHLQFSSIAEYAEDVENRMRERLFRQYRDEKGYLELENDHDYID